MADDIEFLFVHDDGPGAPPFTPRDKALALAVSIQSAFAGFGKQGVIDIREFHCPRCKGPGFNTGMGYLLFACGAELVTGDDDLSEPCGGDHG